MNQLFKTLRFSLRLVNGLTRCARKMPLGGLRDSLEVPDFISKMQITTPIISNTSTHNTMTQEMPCSIINQQQLQICFK